MAATTNSRSDPTAGDQSPQSVHSAPGDHSRVTREEFLIFQRRMEASQKKMEDMFNMLLYRRIAKTTAHLMSMVQGERETLKKFTHHFVTITLEICNLDHGVALVALTTALQFRAFLYSLGKKPPADMGELMARAQKYVNLEEVMDTRTDRAELKERGLEISVSPPGPGKDRRAANHKAALGDRGILGYVSWPEPMRTPSYKRNMSKYCQFHRDHSHDTKEYIHLKNEIEELTKRGHLSKFMKKGDRQREAHEQKKLYVEEKKEPIVGEIVAIFGGPASSGDS
ncbi:uncharacterized protein LOC131145847 [Malania oleifera]|uniref:uncharacterized protein LOC131145847 n=1 Tax=Malania oleifera TaxID=397392 RepID=UPI0025ADF8EE|nr:uncharacterized protein LOC131145847 [Malania oleifera]